VNNQRIMVLMNIDSKFFDIKINFQPMVEDSQSITISKFPTTIGRAVAIETTSDTEELGKYILIVNNKDYDHTKSKVDDVLKYVYEEKDTPSSMKSSQGKFDAYPEVNGGSPVNSTLSETIAKLNAELEEQSNAPTTTVTTHKVPSRRFSIWGDDDDDDELPKEISTTQHLPYAKPPSYKEAALRTTQSTPQRKTSQQDEQQQNQHRQRQKQTKQQKNQQNATSDSMEIISFPA